MIDFSGYKLIIFDKDGTLIDFDAMWGGWVEDLAARLEAAAGRHLARALYAAMDYDPVARRTLAGGRLAVTPMARLRVLTSGVLRSQGLPDDEAERILSVAWQIPDPASTARPLADLPRLFTALRGRGLKIAVATSDDRAPTVNALKNLGILSLVAVIVAADDGVPLKPAPDMVEWVCRETGVEPQQTIVVGDALADLQMGRAAGVGLVVGVASGVSSAALLQPCADLVLEEVGALVAA